MNLTIRLLGVEVFAISTDADLLEDEAGDCTTTGIGFNGYTPDQRYEASPGVDY